jgi:hypothetical protein
VTDSPHDPHQPGGSSPPNTDATIARLEQELAEALARNAQAEALLADQRARLKTLGSGREASMRALTETRDQLRRVSIERDELRGQLARIDGMQTATVTLPDEPTSLERRPPANLPSIEDLMASLSDMKEPDARPSAGHLHLRVHTDPNADASEDMLSPAIVFPEQYAATAQTAGSTELRLNRVLVLLDGEQPIKYPLYKKEMVIGRAETADIQIDSHFISRLHARLVLTETSVVIEDFESKNGIKINSKLTNRQALCHGDLLSLGGLRFRFLDAAADDAG